MNGRQSKQTLASKDLGSDNDDSYVSVGGVLYLRGNQRGHRSANTAIAVPIPTRLDPNNPTVRKMEKVKRHGATFSASTMIFIDLIIVWMMMFNGH